MKNLARSLGLLVAALLFQLSPAQAIAAETKTVDDFRAAADKANAVLTIPEWPQTPDAVTKLVNDAIETANKRLDEIGSQDLKKVTFKSTIAALDDLGYDATTAAYIAGIIK